MTDWAQLSEPLGLVQFCQWLGGILARSRTPEPADCLQSDLGLDHFEVLNVVAELDKLIGRACRLGVDVYHSPMTVREMHLYYLLRTQAPWDLI